MHMHCIVYDTLTLKCQMRVNLCDERSKSDLPENGKSWDIVTFIYVELNILLLNALLGARSFQQ